MTNKPADLQLKDDIVAASPSRICGTSAVKLCGSFAVEPRARRLRALQALAGGGKLGRTHEVCCLVPESGSGGAGGERPRDLQRLSMNPADECVTFQQLIEQGSDVEGIARRSCVQRSGG